MTVGLVGIGLLGSALAERLLAGGFRVIGFDTSAERMACFHGSAAASARDAAARAERLILCLPHSRVARNVLEDIAPALTPAHIVIDTTTGEPGEMQAYGSELAERGVAYIDATVAGSSRQVRAHEAILMAGGDACAIEACRPVFDCIAARTFRTGPYGSGAKMKLIVNLVLGLNRAVLAEGLAFAEACDVDPALALEILKASPAYSRAMDAKGEKMLRRDYTPEARLRQHRKDVQLILAEAERHAARVPLSRTHHDLLTEAEAANFGEADNCSIFEVFRPHG